MDEAFDGPRLVWNRDRKFISVPWDDISPAPTSWLIKGILPQQGTGFMVGASKAGKTFVALDWAFKVASGATVMKRRARQVGVVYLAAEDEPGCRLRIQAIKKKSPRGSYTPFHLIPARVNLQDEEDVASLLAELADVAETFAAEGYPLGLIVLDTFSRCIPGAEENSSAAMSLAVESLDRLGEETGAFVLALAHHGKNGTQSGIRGSSVLDAASDATITVERGDAEKGEDPNVRTITLSKVKNGQDGDQIAFRLERQNLGLFDQDDGEELWSCYVQYDYADTQAVLSKPAKRKALSPNAEIVLRGLGRLVDKEMRQAVPAGIEGVRKGTWAVRRPDLSLECMTLGLRFSDDEKINTYNVRFGRAVAELQQQQRIRQEGDLIWAL